MRELYFGDNLEILNSKIANESVDLVYLDPPFNSDRQYSVIFRSERGHESHAQIVAFDDWWRWGLEAESVYKSIVTGDLANVKTVRLLQALYDSFTRSDMLAYLVMMTGRLLHLHRVLKSKGCLYLHCDPVASHYVKLILDSIFGPENFRSEVIWKRTSSHNNAKRWGPIHDTVLFYSKGNDFYWDKNVRDKVITETNTNPDLLGDGIREGDSGSEWRGFNPTSIGRHWAPPSELVIGVTGLDPRAMTTAQKLDALDEAGLIHWPKKVGGRPRYKLPAEMRGKRIQDVIVDIPPIGAHAQERLGYPTQKPMELLERIIESSCPPNGVVLDPFCGCGTAIFAAEKLKRSWIGIDITHLSIRLVEDHLLEWFNIKPDKVYGVPSDKSGAKELWERNRAAFERWALSLVHAKPRNKIVDGQRATGGDGGVDGEIPLLSSKMRIMVSVKGGKPLIKEVRELAGVVADVGRDKGIGLLVTLDQPPRSHYEWADRQGTVPVKEGGEIVEYPRIQILTIKELMDRTKFPLYPGSSAAMARRRRYSTSVGRKKHSKIQRNLFERTA